MKFGGCIINECFTIIDVPDYVIILAVLIIGFIGYIIFSIIHKLLSGGREEG